VRRFKLVKWLCLSVVLAVAMGTMFAGFGNAADKPPVLTWYFPNSPQPDQELVTAEINKILLKKINATVEIHNIDWGAYADKMKVMIASGEPFDVCYSGNWINDYVTNVNKGAFLAIDGLIAKYAKNYVADVPKALLDAAKIKGKSYGIAPLQVLGRGFDFMGAKKFFDKYGVDPASLKKLEDFTPLLEKIAAGEPGIYPVAMDYRGILQDAWKYYGVEAFSDDNPAGIYMNDDNLKVTNLYETPEFKKHIALMREWYNKGFFRKDAATFKDLMTDLKTKKYAVYFMTVNPDTPGNAAQFFSPTNSSKDVVTGFLTKKFMNSSGLLASFDAISVNSKYPDLAVKMLDLFYDQKDTRLMDLMEYGIPGKHYKRVANDLVERIPNQGYWIDCGWEHGDLFTCSRTTPTQPSWDLGRKMNKEGLVSKIVGFSFDPTAVKSELAQCQSVLGEFRPALVTGSVDPDTVLPQLQAKLKGAGVDKITAEVQKQLDAWKAGKK
jgi:putative aldouronate transport system substrate-binding protein